MSKRLNPSEGERSDKQMELRHLRREVRTALELAVVALAPSEASPFTTPSASSSVSPAT